MRAMSRLEDALLAMAQFLERHHVPYMVVGGVANVVWGIPRTTLDVDITIQVAEEDVEKLIHSLAQVFRARISDPVSFVKQTRVLPLVTKDGVQVDLIFSQLPYEEEAIRRAALQRFQGTDIRVCQPEDLIIYKLVSERPKDREDVRGIIQQQAARLDRAYLDPKVIALARELERSEIALWYEQCWREAGNSGLV